MIVIRRVLARKAAAFHHRRLVEALEDRCLLSAGSSIRFIMPVGLPVNNTTTFATLDAALNAGGLNAGDVIQIEPGAAPGQLDVTSPPAANLTIQGDPAASLASIPMFTLGDTFTVAANQSGFTLLNVNVGLIYAGGATTGGRINATGNLTISGSSVVDIGSTMAPVITLRGASNSIVNSTFVVDASVGSAYIEVIPPSGGSSNTISRNTFVVNDATVSNVLVYNLSSATVTDKVQFNTFVAGAGATVFKFVLMAAGDLTGLTISNNSFSSASGTTSIAVTASAHNITISNNIINTAGGSGVIFDPDAVAVVSASVSNNLFRTGAGNGIQIVFADATPVFNLNIQGNDFHDNAIGVNVLATGAGALGGIDLGGGSRGSIGGNNFRSFTAGGAPSAAAIALTSASSATGTLSAQGNIFATGVTPSLVIYDPASKVAVINPLASNAAFVQTLYENFLKRPGNTANAGDAGYWVNAITGGSMTTAQAAASIARSPEALGVLVDGLYGRYLGRLPDPGGRAYFVGVLQASGGGVETMIAQLVTSAEYTQQFGSDGNFMQSLYARLLGRLGSASDVAFWTTTLATGSSRASVASSFLNTSEFRGDVARQFYGFSVAPLVTTASIFLPLLDRTVAPGASEINYWATNGQDLLTMEVTFVQTGEYFTNG